MPHDSSTPTPIGSHENFVSPLPEHFSRAQPSRRGEDAPTTAWDRFLNDRSDSAFHAFAGATGGFMSGIVTCPLDVIKTKLQAQGGFRAAQKRLSLPQKAAVYNGMLGTGKVILSEEGIRGLYRGLGPIILGYLPTWAVWFTVYGKAKACLSTTSSMYRPYFSLLMGCRLTHAKILSSLLTFGRQLLRDHVRHFAQTRFGS